MPLPLTGPLSILNIRNGFTTGPGGTDVVPHQLGEFYAGGVYVPSGTTGINGAIPGTVGDPISISDFYGAPVEVYLRPTHNLWASTGGAGGTANVGIRMYSTGITNARVAKTEVGASSLLRIDGVAAPSESSATSFQRNFLTSVDATLYSIDEWSKTGTTVTGYSVRASWAVGGIDTGVTPTGTFGTWMTLGTTTREWYLETGSTDQEIDLTLDIKFTADTTDTILTTSTISLRAFSSL